MLSVDRRLRRAEESMFDGKVVLLCIGITIAGVVIVLAATSAVMGIASIF